MQKEGIRTFSHSKGESFSPFSCSQTMHNSERSLNSGWMGSSLSLSLGLARKYVVCAPAAVLFGII
jgi:hypothetical protein